VLNNEVEQHPESSITIGIAFGFIIPFLASLSTLFV